MITGRVTGHKSILRRLETIQHGLPLLVSKERMGSFLVRRIKERFLKEVDPDRVPWASWSPETRAHGEKKLLRHGYLYEGIQVLSGSEDGVRANTGAGFYIGVKNRSITEQTEKGHIRRVQLKTYAIVHQRGNASTPRRRYLGFGSLDVKAVDSLLRREIRKLVKTNG